MTPSVISSFTRKLETQRNCQLSAVVEDEGGQVYISVDWCKKYSPFERIIDLIIISPQISSFVWYIKAYPFGVFFGSHGLIFDKGPILKRQKGRKCRAIGNSRRKIHIRCL